MKREHIKYYRLAFYILGMYVICDGIGSIIVYQSQPWFWDHMMRVIRMIVGVGVIFIGERAIRPAIKSS
jgi:hypothetical protein